ncbi:MAG: tRNA pseudouridine(38-40) synthase TruA [Betaproteobacteria bacterium]|nr:tRNA pseudouridine(38-40) synthase TruA [Betaproteobacteria bacterium]
MKVAIGVTYDGGPFEGWQSQASGRTVQDHLERALTTVASSPVRLVAAGRTDAGVHALGQVAHFETEVERPLQAWVRGANSALPAAIAVQWAQHVPDAFSARYSATARTYRYLLYCHPVRPAVLAGRVGWYHLPLDLEAMQTAGRLLLGEHDFSAFRSIECQAKSPVRNLRRLGVAQRGPYFVFDFTADAFLHHMVRNIVGCLVYVGKGRHAPDWMADVLASRDRSRAAPTFGPAGLYLAEVRYGPEWNLPGFPPIMPFFSAALPE